MENTTGLETFSSEKTIIQIINEFFNYFFVNIHNNKVLTILFITFSATLSTPGLLNKLYTENKIFRFIYFYFFIFEALIYTKYESQIGSPIIALIATLCMLLIYDLLKTSNDGYVPFFKDFTTVDFKNLFVTNSSSNTYIQSTEQYKNSNNSNELEQKEQEINRLKNQLNLNQNQNQNQNNILSNKLQHNTITKKNIHPSNFNSSFTNIY